MEPRRECFDVKVLGETPVVTMIEGVYIPEANQKKWRNFRKE